MKPLPSQEQKWGVRELFLYNQLFKLTALLTYSMKTKYVSQRNQYQQVESQSEIAQTSKVDGKSVESRKSMASHSKVSLEVNTAHVLMGNYQLQKMFQAASHKIFSFLS